MGVKGLMKWIEKYAPSSIKKQPMKSLTGRTIAIDASLSIYQSLVAVRHMGNQLTDQDGNTTSHLQGILSRTTRYMTSGIKPIYVFDGKPPEIKSGELQKRSDRRKEAEEHLEAAIAEGNEEAIEKFTRRTVSLDQSQVQECQRLLTLMGIPWILAPCEAEAECAALARAGIAYATATEDMDALAHSTPILLRHFSFSSGSSDEVTEINFARLLEESGLTRDEFIDFCILCGCDYCDRIQGIGPENAYKLIQQHHTIENVVDHIQTTKYTLPESFNFVEARRLFQDHEVTIDFKPKWTAPDADGLKQFMVTEKNFNISRITSTIESLNKARKGGRQMPMDSFFSPVKKIEDPSKKKAAAPAKKPPPKKFGKKK